MKKITATKYLTITLLGAIAMFVVSFLYGIIEHIALEGLIYTAPVFKNFEENMPVFFVSIFALQLFHSFILTCFYQHVRMRKYNFSILAFSLVYINVLTMNFILMPIDIASLITWAISGLIQTLAWSFVAIRMINHAIN